jgi:hypothetical protein
MKSKALIFLCLFGGSFASAADDVFQRITLSDAQEKAMRDGIAYHLVDPESARFRNLRSAKHIKTGTLLVCGEVNAKNRFGGYIGYTPFMASLENGQTTWGYLIADESNKRTSGGSLAKACAKAGLGEAPVTQ